MTKVKQTPTATNTRRLERKAKRKKDRSHKGPSLHQQNATLKAKLSAAERSHQRTRGELKEERKALKGVQDENDEYQRKIKELRGEKKKAFQMGATAAAMFMKTMAENGETMGDITGDNIMEEIPSIFPDAPEPEPEASGAGLVLGLAVAAAKNAKSDLHPDLMPSAGTVDTSPEPEPDVEQALAEGLKEWVGVLKGQIDSPQQKEWEQFLRDHPPTADELKEMGLTMEQFKATVPWEEGGEMGEEWDWDNVGTENWSVGAFAPCHGGIVPGGFTPRTEPSQVKPATFDGQACPVCHSVSIRKDSWSAGAYRCYDCNASFDTPVTAEEVESLRAHQAGPTPHPAMDGSMRLTITRKGEAEPEEIILLPSELPEVAADTYIGPDDAFKAEIYHAGLASWRNAPTIVGLTFKGRDPISLPLSHPPDCGCDTCEDEGAQAEHQDSVDAAKEDDPMEAFEDEEEDPELDEEDDD